MDRADWLTEQFEANRPRLRAVAYRMLGSRAEADDALQEAWLKVARADSEALENVQGWLTTVVGRVCLDRLRSRRSRPEEPADVDLAPRTLRVGDEADPEHQALIADSVGSALLVVLDSLAPAERVAFVLHDVFAVPFDDIGEILGRSADAARQLASRARRRVQGSPATAEVDLVRHREVVDAFLAAARGGDFQALVGLLDPDVVLRPDAAALRMGALRPTRGAAEVAGALAGGARAARLALVDGVTALVWAPGGRVRGVVEFTIADGRILAIDVVGDRERLDRLDIVLVGD
ncbi:MAG TPA: sigma-70 family RNA polymerase sigma factor [Acidimicrobiales bacterium]|nr:sigma-70 family RNA polymerase sigma factor [Acidimicrobiales bacterium]